MSGYPIYQDALAVSKQKNGYFPFYILHNRIPHKSELHHHDFAELSFVISGCGYETINGQNHRMLPGTISILLPHHIHFIESDKDNPLSLYSCMFDLSILLDSDYDSGLSNLILTIGIQIPSFLGLDTIMAARIKHNLDEIMEESSRDYFGKNIFIRHKLIETLLLIMREHRSKASSAIVNQLSDSSSDLLRSIIQYTHTHYLESLSLKKLSEIYNKSCPYLSRVFKAHMGQSFNDYLHALRVNRAATLLVTSDISITDVSVEAGFEHFRTFSRTFKELKGITPKQYRSKYMPSKVSSQITVP
ncbi:MAG: AraC family transcriptional regulator [Paenibacillus sp.]|nr:AraC family transcriptional regulator [Paenibacillus sp.]